MNFDTFRSAVATQFARMQSYPMYSVSIDKDLLWSTYLDSFPPGTNNLYRERREYDCSCCRQFIRAVGDVVAYIDGRLESIWDIQVSEPAYEVVSMKLAELVKSHPIHSPFSHYEKSAGTVKSFEMDPESLSETPVIKTWTHFHVNINKSLVIAKDEIPTAISKARSEHDVFLRALREITIDSIDTVLDLISQNSLYRGEEHRNSVETFRKAKVEFSTLSSPESEDLYAWTSRHAGGHVTHIRNTAIGTLLTDLSNGVDLEEAVKSFESKVAPTNYKRPSSLITPAMIQKARETVQSLGLESALERRFATINDININNLLFTDRSRPKVDSDVFDDLSSSSSTRKPQKLDRVEEVSIDRFLSDILPRVESIELMFENRHQHNLVSLIAPSDPTAGRLFKWDNGFSWSYAGEFADAIKERVKKAGGSVTGDVCCRLGWYNFDDLDLHIIEPGKRTGYRPYEIYFGNRYTASPGGGRLDVDMNAGGGLTREPVENIFYSNRSTMPEGEYHLYVHQYNKRESDNVGFEVELDYLGTVHRFVYDKPVAQNTKVTVVKFTYSRKTGLEIVESLPSTESTRSTWNIQTQQFHKINAITLSPNHWNADHPIGNKHYFFMLANCTNDGTARGFYNEFLHESLSPHRKVFEVLGAKMKPADSPNHLSGLGFSSTRRDSVVCRVKGSFTRLVRITF